MRKRKLTWINFRNGKPLTKNRQGKFENQFSNDKKLIKEKEEEHSIVISMQLNLISIEMKMKCIKIQNLIKFKIQKFYS